ncbi:MAG: long-chain fatty acid--CoA ligase [Gammaproteobacteria bacterium]|nr:long-chain fatty acid--CoA ligase [Gammaproteobacteria bacterium]
MQHTPLTMSRIISRGATLQPNSEIVTATDDGVRRQTYAQTVSRSNQLANALQRAGMEIGDRVGTFMWNGSRHVEAYYATANMGVVLHTVNIRLSPVDLEYVINHAEDKLMIVDADLLPTLEQLKERIPTVERFVIAAEPGLEDWETSLPNTIDYEEFIGDMPTVFDPPDIHENAPLGLCYTSGTTGNPKGVEYEHRAQFLHTLAICMTDAMSLSATDTLCGIVPMFHAMGWGLPWAGLMLGCKQVLPHRFMSPERLVDLMSQERVTLSAGVPTIWQGIKAFIEQNPKKHDLSQVSRLTCGGSAPPESLVEWYWDELGVEMIQGWGMTETSPLGTLARRTSKQWHLTASPSQLTQNSCKAGLLMPGLELDVFDEDFNRVPHDGESVGEILIRGPWICSEYFRDPQPSKFHEDWLITGDVGSIDPEENLIIADRSKDLVKSGGEWISSVDLENHIVAMDGIAQACVVAQPHPRWGERPVALVVLDDSESVSADEIKDHCSLKFAKWQLPDDVLYVDHIPLTSTGKLDKKTVRAQLDTDGYVLPDMR